MSESQEPKDEKQLENKYKSLPTPVLESLYSRTGPDRINQQSWSALMAELKRRRVDVGSLLPPPEIEEPVSAAEAEVLTRPWVRYAARWIDYGLFTLACDYFFIGISWILGRAGVTFETSDMFDFIVYYLLLLGVFSLFLWAFIEALLLCRWGTTPGKWWLNVKITDGCGEKLSYSVALKRSLLVFTKGMAGGIILFSWIANIIAYRRLEHKGSTSWDETCQCTVEYGEFGWVRGGPVLFYYIILPLIALIYLLVKAD